MIQSCQKVPVSTFRLLDEKSTFFRDGVLELTKHELTFRETLRVLSDTFLCCRVPKNVRLTVWSKKLICYSNWVSLFSRSGMLGVGSLPLEVTTFGIYYQPQFLTLLSGVVLTFEILRWLHCGSVVECCD